MFYLYEMQKLPSLILFSGTTSFQVSTSKMKCHALQIIYVHLFYRQSKQLDCRVKLWGTSKHMNFHCEYLNKKIIIFTF